MGELRVDLFSTVDGFGGPGPRPAPYWGYGGPGLQSWIDAQLDEDHLTLMGANTYRALVAVGEHDPRMAALPKVVFSRSLQPPLSWANTTLVADPVETAVPKLKAEDDRPMRTIGSASLVRSLFRLGLVDRLRLMVFPVVHGPAGEEPVFAGLPTMNLDLVGSTVFDERLVFIDYRVS